MNVVPKLAKLMSGKIYSYAVSTAGEFKEEFAREEDVSVGHLVFFSDDGEMLDGETLEDGVMYSIMRLIPQIILNTTEGSYFMYLRDYEKVLATLFEKDAFGVSRWLPSDKIVFVPEHIQEYVIKTYEKVFV